jgi:hypothetical protein
MGEVPKERRSEMRVSFTIDLQIKLMTNNSHLLEVSKRETLIS